MKYKKKSKTGKIVDAKPKKKKGVEGYSLAHKDGKKSWLNKVSFESRFVKV